MTCDRLEHAERFGLLALALNRVAWIAEERDWLSKQPPKEEDAGEET